MDINSNRHLNTNFLCLSRYSLSILGRVHNVISTSLLRGLFISMGKSLSIYLVSLQGASLASAPPSVAFARFARSITGRDVLARFRYSECGLRSLQLLQVWLTLASLAHSHGCDEVGREHDYSTYLEGGNGSKILS